MNMLQTVATSPAGRSLANAHQGVRDTRRQIKKLIPERHHKRDELLRRIREARYWKSVIELLT